DLAMWVPATHFASTAAGWRLPNAALTKGFYLPEESGTGVGSWALRDMNGDGKPDLVMTRDQANAIYGTAAAQKWHVYLSTGSGFATTATDWALPNAGLTKGFFLIDQSAAGTGSWATLDLNGDKRPDLVMTRDQADMIYGSLGAQKWHVYL